MARRIVKPRHEVPFLPEQHIEQHADLLIAEYGEAHESINQPPVPIGDIVELHLRLTYELEDLKALFGHPDVLGAIWFKDGIVRVDQSLDPHDNPNLLGRYNFTLAHETGHWQLHRQHYTEDPNQAKLFDGRGMPAFVCRSSQKPPAEWQADCFAGYLLMPRNLVLAAWEQWRDSLDPVSVDELPTVNLRSDKNTNQSAAMEIFCKPLAARFEVSAEAMRIRLEKLGLLLRERSNTLF